MPGIRFKIIGRADDMLIIKGVNVYPEAIKAAILKFSPDVTGIFRILLDKPGPVVQSPLRIKLEYGTGLKKNELSTLEEKITARFKEELRIAPQFEWMPPETMPRGTKKTTLTEIKSDKDPRSPQ
jgi:phenylacetate-CoA ligase